MTTDAAAPGLALVTSPDGQWVAARDDRELLLFAGSGGAALARSELPSADCEVALVGPPTALAVLSRHAGAHHIVLHATPTLEVTARLDLDAPAQLAAVTGPRIAVLSADARQVAIVRSAGRALATQRLEIAGPIDFVVGLERNQLLFGLPRKLEVWDAVSARPLLRAQFQLPPAPRLLGASIGHLWAATVDSEEVFLYRLSDGRPFRHHVGAPILEVVCHPTSPLLVVVTRRGLVRLNTYAHSLTLIEGVPERRGALAQLVVGDDIQLLGFIGRGEEPWRISITQATATGTVPPPLASTAPAITAPATTAPATAGATTTTSPSSLPALPSRPASAAAARWREPLVMYAQDLLLRGPDVEPPAISIDTELGELAHRLALSAVARRALVALYALHLVGEPALAIASLARVIGDWPEALGQGELAALAMLRSKHGKVALRTAVTDYIDGAAPRTIRLVGSAAVSPRAGAFRMSRDSRSDAEIEAALVDELGRIALVEGPLPRALLEARLHGATAVALSVPPERPRPWPRDAGLVLVLYGTNASWVADLPTLAPAAASATA